MKRGFADHCGGTIVEEAEVDGLVLRHEAEPGDPRPELSGHFHPKLHLTLRGRRIARRCFVASRDQADPAGVRRAHRRAGCAHPAIVGAVGRRPRRWCRVADRLLRFPLAA